MDATKLGDLRARLLAVKAIGDGEMKRVARELRFRPVDLISAATDGELRPDHARKLCEFAIPVLCDSADTNVSIRKWGDGCLASTGACAATRWRGVRDLRLVRVFAVLRGGRRGF